MIQLRRTDSKEADFLKLVALLDADLAQRDGDEDHAFYDQFNSVDSLNHIIVAYENNIAVGCGAYKIFDENTVEIKRMYVPECARGKGIAKIILKSLEKWAAEEGFKNCVLETGKKQPEAMSLYSKSGYKLRSNYGQYIGIKNSLCYQKQLRSIH